MGQAQSPPKYSARPTSTLFHNNLASKIKDAAFKKHISSHGFVRKSNLRQVKGSHLSKSSNSSRSSSNNSNLKVLKQTDNKKNKQKNTLNLINIENNQNPRLSEIQQNEEEYVEQDIKKSIILNSNQKNSENYFKDKVQKSNRQDRLRQQNKFTNIEISQQKQGKSNSQMLGLQSQNDQSNLNSNLMLCVQSKKKSSCKSGSHFSKSNLSQLQKSNPSYKQFKSSYVQCKVDFGLSFDKQIDQPLTVKSNENKTKFSKLIKQSIEVSLNQPKQTVKQAIKNSKQKQLFKMSKSNDINENQDQMNATLRNSQRKIFKGQTQITIRMNKLAQTLHEQQVKHHAKSSEELFHSARKIYASQLSSSKISIPSQLTSQVKNKLQNSRINNLINSKNFQSDIEVSKCSKNSSLYQRKSSKNRSKLRQSISLKKSQQKQTFNIKTEQNQERGNNVSRICLISKFRSKHSKASSSKSFSQKENSLNKSKKQLTISNQFDNSKQQKFNAKEAAQIQKNFIKTQESYFNQNKDKNDLLQNKIHSKKSNKQEKLKNSIMAQTMKPSEYEVKAVKQNISSINQSNIDKFKTQEIQRIQYKTRNARKLYVFTDQMTYSFKQNNLDQTKNYVVKVDEQKKKNQLIASKKEILQNQNNQNSNFNIEEIIIQQNKRCAKQLNSKEKKRLEYDKQISKNQNRKIKQKQQSRQKTANQINKSSRLNENYLKKDVKQNHLSVQYSIKKNPEPSDKKVLKLIKFSQLEPNAFDIINNQKMIQTTSAKNYPYGEQSAKLPQKIQQQNSLIKSINVIEKLINQNSNSKQMINQKKQHTRNKDYQQFLQELKKLKRIKQIQQNLIQDNIERLKKSSSSNNKISIFDLNKQAINQQVSTRIERMNKLKQLNKLTKKIDPALLVKSKSSQFLREQHLKRSQKKNPRKYDLDYQNSLQTQLYNSIAKNLNRNYLKQSNYINSSKLIQSSKDLLNCSQDYMMNTIDFHRLSQPNSLPRNLRNSVKKTEGLNVLASISQSPQIKTNFNNRQHRLSYRQTFDGNFNQKLGKTLKQISHSLEHGNESKYREEKQMNSTSLQKIPVKKALIVF